MSRHHRSPFEEPRRPMMLRLVPYFIAVCAVASIVGAAGIVGVAAHFLSKVW